MQLLIRIDYFNKRNELKRLIINKTDCFLSIMTGDPLSSPVSDGRVFI